VGTSIAIRPSAIGQHEKKAEDVKSLFGRQGLSSLGERLRRKFCVSSILEWRCGTSGATKSKSPGVDDEPSAEDFFLRPLRITNGVGRDRY